MSLGQASFRPVCPTTQWRKPSLEYKRHSPFFPASPEVQLIGQTVGGHLTQGESIQKQDCSDQMVSPT